MKKELLAGVILAIILLSIAIPVLAQYYAYLTIEESDGNSYTNLAVSCSRNITQLVDYDIITSTGLDTRVLTGEGSPLPHMLANDRIMFVTDLAADEEKTLIFYCGASSLADFPIIVGNDGYITTPDDPDLELGYVLELLASGPFDASGSTEGPILYKQDAFKMNISAANTLRVAALEAGDAEQWDLTYGSFTTGVHTIYVVANGLVAYLYVDDMGVAKDTANLFSNTSYQILNKVSSTAFCVYDEGYYWVFYKYDSTHLGYVTSPDGVTWSGETSIALDASDTLSDWGMNWRNGYIHVSYCYNSGTDYIRYRRGDLTSSPSITWSAAWQTVISGTGNYYDVDVCVDSSNYPYVTYERPSNRAYVSKSSTNDGTWATAGGYPFQIFYTGVHPGQVEDFEYYPDGDEMLILYTRDDFALGWQATYCRYFNGSSWESEDDISAYANGMTMASMAGDEDGNMYIGWCAGTTYPRPQYLTVRYAGDTWQKEDINTSYGYGAPQVTYNEDNDVLYLLYEYRDDPGTHDVYCVTINTDEMEMNEPIYIMGTPDATSYPYGGVAYGDHITFVLNDDPNTEHGALDLTAYAWEDNSNNWTWMQNNVMPYSDYFLMAIDGTTHLQYQPATIIQSATLPDISGASGNDGIITWGSNPAGVTTSLSVMQSETEEEETPIVVPPGEAGFTDVVGPTGQPDWTSGLPTLATNPLYPLVSVINSVTSIPIGLIWIIGATFILLVAMIVCVKKVPHLIIAALVGGGLSAFFFAMGIYPFWVIFIFAAMAIAVIVGERSPTV